MTSKPPKKIIFINRFFFPDHSATSQILSDIAFHLAKKNYCVSIIASRGFYGDNKSYIDAFETINGVKIYRVYKPSFDRKSLVGRTIDYLFMYACFIKAVFTIAQQDDIIVTMTDPPMLSVPISIVTRVRGLRQINWLQDVFPEVAVAFGLQAIKINSWLLIFIRNMSLKMGFKTIVISDGMKTILEKNGINQEKLKVIHNWCHDEEIKPISGRLNKLREMWDLNNKFVVGYCGNLGRAHEFETILAAARILKNTQNLVFLFVGGGALIESMRDAIKREGLDSLFRFFPYQEQKDLSNVLTCPDVHLISLKTSMEGLIFPSKFYGISAAGRPMILVGNGMGELAEIIRNNDCGSVVQEGDGQKLAQVILELMKDPMKVEIMGRNARTVLGQGYLRNQALTKWEQVVSEIVSCS